MSSSFRIFSSFLDLCNSFVAAQFLKFYFYLRIAHPIDSLHDARAQNDRNLTDTVSPVDPPTVYLGIRRSKRLCERVEFVLAQRRLFLTRGYGNCSETNQRLTRYFCGVPGSRLPTPTASVSLTFNNVSYNSGTERSKSPKICEQSFHHLQIMNSTGKKAGEAFSPLQRC